MKYARVMTWMALLSGLSGCVGLTSSNLVPDDDSPLASPDLARVPPPVLSGQVPLHRVVDLGIAGHVLTDLPRWMYKDTDTNIPISPYDDWWKIIKKIETICSVTYDAKTKSFREATATHSVDAPDAAGRSTSERPLSQQLRQMIAVKFRFVRGNAGLAFDPVSLSASGSMIQQQIIVPAGQSGSFGSADDERYYYEQAVTTSTSTPGVINTERKTDRAGVLFEGVAGVLPGGNFRINATLEVSTFGGDGSKSQVQVPVNYDGERGKWHQIFDFRAGSAALQAKLRGMGLNIKGSADLVMVFVRVD